MNTKARRACNQVVVSVQLPTLEAIEACYGVRHTPMMGDFCDLAKLGCRLRSVLSHCMNDREITDGVEGELSYDAGILVQGSPPILRFTVRCLDNDRKFVSRSIRMRLRKIGPLRESECAISIAMNPRFLAELHSGEDRVE